MGGGVRVEAVVVLDPVVVLGLVGLVGLVVSSSEAAEAMVVLSDVVTVLSGVVLNPPAVTTFFSS